MTRPSFSVAMLAVCTAILALSSPILMGAQTVSVIHSFHSTSTFDGLNPLSGVVADKNGALYGTTESGGKFRAGTIYQLVPPAIPGGAWTQNIIYAFTGRSDGAYPSGKLVLRSSGRIYGTTQAGGGPYSCGVVYQLSPPTKIQKNWTETVLYTFCEDGSGNDPVAGLITDGNGRLYGTTYKGGSLNAGSVFVLSPPAQGGSAWKGRILQSFQSGSDGSLPSPSGLAIDADGALYGVLQQSGASPNDAGTVFKLSPPAGGGGGPWTEQVLYSFKANPDGDRPIGAPVIDANGVLYGATLTGGQYGGGSVFSLSPPSIPGGAWSENLLYSFTAQDDGRAPNSELAFDNTGSLYGLTVYGGNPSCDDTGVGCGVAYKLIPPIVQDGNWTEETLHAFSGGSDGASPWAQGPLLVQGTNLYGTTITGGTGTACTGGCGTIFQITQ